MIRALLVLGRVSNLPTVWTNCIAGYFLAGGTWDGRLGWVAAGASLLYSGGMFLNDACDVAFDREHCAERPIPAGRISRKAVTVLSVLLLVAGAGILLVLDSSAVVLVAALVAAIVLYDLVHKRWAGSVLIMGACRFLLVGVSGSVAAGAFAPRAVWIAAAGLFCYIVGVSVTARGESTGGKAAPWSFALLFGPVAAWLVLEPARSGAIFAVIFGAWFALQMRRLRLPGGNRIGPYVGAMLAGIVLADALVVSTVGAGAAWICVAFLPVNLLLQRYVPAT